MIHDLPLACPLARTPFSRITARNHVPWKADFTLGQVPEGVVFARASSAMNMDATGTLVPVGLHMPRFAYAPVSHAYRGLMVESQGTNLQFPHNSASGVSSVTGGTVTYGVATGPDGTPSWNKFTEGTVWANHNIVSLACPVVAGQPVTTSAYVKALNRPRVAMGNAFSGTASNVWIELATGGITRIDGTCTPEVTNLGGGVFRLAVTSISAKSAAGFGINASTPQNYIGYTGEGVDAFLWYGLQVEQGAFASSLIPSTNGATTRAAEYLTVPQLDALNGNATEGTWFVEATVPTYRSAGHTLLHVGDGTLANRMQLGVDSTGAIQPRITLDGVDYHPSSPGVVAAGGVIRAALTYKKGEGMGLAAVNGNVSITPSTLPGLPAPSTWSNGLWLGSAPALWGSQPGAVYIRRAAYYPAACSAQQLQALTA